jgi:hypothetical protein
MNIKYIIICIINIISFIIIIIINKIINKFEKILLLILKNYNFLYYKISWYFFMKIKNMSAARTPNYCILFYNAKRNSYSCLNFGCTSVCQPKLPFKTTNTSPIYIYIYIYNPRMYLFFKLWLETSI